MGRREPEPRRRVHFGEFGRLRRTIGDGGYRPGMGQNGPCPRAGVCGRQTWGTQLYPGAPPNAPVKPEAVAWVAGLDTDSGRRVLSQVQGGWATLDPKSMAALARASSELFPQHTESLLAREMARQDPSGALEWASR